MRKCKIMKQDVFEDRRGKIISFYPNDNMVEYNLIITNQGEERGYHYHPEFNEYILIVDGTCQFTEYDGDHETTVTVETGDSIFIPRGVPHSFLAVTDLKFVSLLNKLWHESKNPIINIREKTNT